MADLISYSEDMAKWLFVFDIQERGELMSNSLQVYDALTTTADHHWRTFYNAEGPAATLTTEHGVWGQGHLTRLGDVGGVLRLDADRGAPPIPGNEVMLRLQIDRRQAIDLTAFVLEVRQVDQQEAPTALDVVFRFEQGGPKSAQTQGNRRRDTRVPTDDLVAPVAWAEHPLFVLERLQFRVIDLSTGGIGFVMPARHQGLLPGMTLEMKLTLPALGTHDVQVRISSVAPQHTPQGHSLLRLGGRFEDFELGFQHDLGRYLVAHPDGPSLKHLAQSGLAVSNLDRLVAIDEAHTEAELAQVKELRYQAYQDAYNYDFGSAEHMWDDFDPHSRLFLARLGHRAVATGRLVFNNGHQHRAELQSLYAIPDWLWQEGFSEISRIAIHPEFRGGEILGLLMARMGWVMLQGGHRYLVGLSSDRLYPLYHKFGAKKIGETSHWAMKRAIVFFIDVEGVFRGSDASPLVWQPFIANLADDLYRRHGMPLTWRGRLWKALKPIAEPLVQYQLQRRMRRRHQLPPQADNLSQSKPAWA
ncbi:PilZ domain-containing protein [Candidatus Entotheonella palauensis]|uniref:PilZ domain-containing protein n=1 Tax=Candidatus Entotheonella palauensis TaxID=93172 RepID=UPI000B7CEC66|nr:PilZ domain-containing protein [Candidatus Entotheonella palauensis]